MTSVVYLLLLVIVAFCAALSYRYLKKEGTDGKRKLVIFILSSVFLVSFFMNQYIMSWLLLVLMSALLVAAVLPDMFRNRKKSAYAAVLCIVCVPMMFAMLMKGLASSFLLLFLFVAVSFVFAVSAVTVMVYLFSNRRLLFHAAVILIVFYIMLLMSGYLNSDYAKCFYAAFAAVTMGFFLILKERTAFVAALAVNFVTAIAFVAGRQIEEYEMKKFYGYYSDSQESVVADEGILDESSKDMTDISSENGYDDEKEKLRRKIRNRLSEYQDEGDELIVYNEDEDILVMDKEISLDDMTVELSVLRTASYNLVFCIVYFNKEELSVSAGSKDRALVFEDGEMLIFNESDIMEGDYITNVVCMEFFPLELAYSNIYGYEEGSLENRYLRLSEKNIVKYAEYDIVNNKLTDTVFEIPYSTAPLFLEFLQNNL